jgi:hypothetical protein
MCSATRWHRRSVITKAGRSTNRVKLAKNHARLHRAKAVQRIIAEQGLRLETDGFRGIREIPDVLFRREKSRLVDGWNS